MSVINKIMESAMSDVDVLRRLDADNDNFALFREVDFHFRCPDKAKAELVAEFLTDFQFGQAQVSKHEANENDPSANEAGEYCVDLVISMPVTQNIISCVSGFMVCIAELYDIEFDGWGCCAVQDD